MTETSISKVGVILGLTVFEGDVLAVAVEGPGAEQVCVAAALLLHR